MSEEEEDTGVITIDCCTLYVSSMSEEEEDTRCM